MGLWGAAQAIGFAGGGLIGTAASDFARWLLGAPGPAYACVFAAEALLFVAAAVLAQRIAIPSAEAGGDVTPALPGVPVSPSEERA
jgi:BCD family chlorophyll transporter-like MFS transporter